MSSKSPSPRIQRKRQQKNTLLLDHAMQIIIEKGVSSLTMRTLAQKVDMTPGALYRYFPSKGHIIGALGNRTLSLYTKTIHHTVEQVEITHQNESPYLKSLITLVSISKSYFDISFQHYENYRILNLIMVNETRYMTNPPDYTTFMEGAVGLLKFTALQYEKAAKLGALEKGDYFSYALSVFGLLQGCLQLVKFGEEIPDLINPKHVHRHSLFTHLIGLGARKNDAHSAISVLYKA